MSRQLVISLVFSVGLLPALSIAHHNFRSVYNFNETTVVEGAFVRLDLVNPHARIYIDVTNDAGETEQWVVEAPGKLALARRGWTDDMFADGEQIAVTGNPAYSGGNAIWIVKIARESGSEVIDPLIEDELAIEAERRARRESRSE